jgi:hypothetical protein
VYARIRSTPTSMLCKHISRCWQIQGCMLLSHGTQASRARGVLSDDKTQDSLLRKRHPNSQSSLPTLVVPFFSIHLTDNCFCEFCCLLGKTKHLDDLDTCGNSFCKSLTFSPSIGTVGINQFFFIQFLFNLRLLWPYDV